MYKNYVAGFIYVNLYVTHISAQLCTSLYLEILLIKLIMSVIINMAGTKVRIVWIFILFL